MDSGSSISQWINANTSMSKLLGAGIPYCWDAGNHDQIPFCNSNGDWVGSNFLAYNATCMRSQSYWVDDIYNSKNTAVRFTVDSTPFLVINMEYQANNSVLAWMENLLKESLGSNVIVATHSYLNNTAGYGYTPMGEGAWQNNLETTLNSYPNVFLTLNGHDNLGNGANNTRVGNREEIFFNRQGIDSDKGAASVRIYTFNLTSMQISVKTFLIYTQSFLTDSYNQFSFNVTLQNDNVNNIFPYFYYWISPSYKYYISFSQTCSASIVSQAGTAWDFTNLTLNGKNSDLNVTSNGANIVITNCDPNGWINYTVTGRGTQIFSVNKAPASVHIDGLKASGGWTYSNGVLTVSGAASTVAINFIGPHLRSQISKHLRPLHRLPQRQPPPPRLPPLR